MAKLEINLMQVQCENKVYRKMVAKFEDVTMRLKHQVKTSFIIHLKIDALHFMECFMKRADFLQLATSIADRDQMRAEIINTNNSNQVTKRNYDFKLNL